MATTRAGPSVRSWLGNASRVVRKRNVRVAPRRFAATATAAATPEDQPQFLETVEDWSQFQQNRALKKSLMEYMSDFGSTQNRESVWQPHHSLHRPQGPNETTVSALLASGAHLGHNKSLQNPNFVPYAYGTRAGLTIIDLDATLPLLRRAANLVRGVAARGGSIVFVGSRPDLRAVVKRAAERLGPQGFHVGYRWLPGTLTNKKEVFGREQVQAFQIVPDLVVFLNPGTNLAAIRECAIEHVPTIGIVDSNMDPRIVMYPIPANDESTRAAELIAGVLSIAGREGVMIKQEMMENEMDDEDDDEDEEGEMAEEMEEDGRTKDIDPAL